MGDLPVFALRSGHFGKIELATESRGKSNERRILTLSLDEKPGGLQLAGLLV